MLRHLVFADCAASPDCTDPHLCDVFVAMAYGMRTGMSAFFLSSCAAPGHPFCVHEEPTGKHLVFRRVFVPSEKEKDRPRRMADAIEAMQLIPEVQRYARDDAPKKSVVVPTIPTKPWSMAIAPSTYNPGVGRAGPARPGPVLGPNPWVQWPLDASVEEHIRIVPALLRWTQWDALDHGWMDLRCDVAQRAAGRREGGAASGGVTPRHLRLAQIMDFVGTRALQEGHAVDACITRCKQLASKFSMGHVEVTTDPGRGRGDGAIVRDPGVETGCIVDVRF